MNGNSDMVGGRFGERDFDGNGLTLFGQELEPAWPKVLYNVDDPHGNSCNEDLFCPLAPKNAFTSLLYRG